MIIVHAIWGMPRTSGVSTFCAEVAAEQARLGHRVIILNDHDDRCPVDPSVERITGASMDMVNVRPDVVHVHAFWSMFAVRVMRWCRRHHVPYVVSPHGGLMPRVFTVGRFKKKMFWLLALRPLLNCACRIHCTGESEVAVCRDLRLESPCFIAPLGVRMPRADMSEHIDCGKRMILFLGRLSEEKGLIMLLDAWKQIGRANVSAPMTSQGALQLVLAGPDWRNYRAKLEAKIVAEKINDVVFVGSADEEKKHRLYREADVFVLPSPMENFSMVVLEALAHGVPVIATKGTPWQVLEQERCGWWIDATVDSLKSALMQALSLSDLDFKGMGVRAKSLVADRFQWICVAERVLAAYLGNNQSV